MMVLGKEDEASSNVNENINSLSEEELEQEYSLSLANGKKNLLCGDFPEAVSCFQHACFMRSEQFGDTSHECAEAFFYYGKALLELARMENTVLGNALKGVPETEESDSEVDEQFEKTKNMPVEERERLRQDVEAAMATEEDESMEEQDTSDDTKTAEEMDEGAGVSDTGDISSKASQSADTERATDEKNDQKQSTAESETPCSDIKPTDEAQEASVDSTAGKQSAGTEDKAYASDDKVTEDSSKSERAEKEDTVSEVKPSSDNTKEEIADTDKPSTSKDVSGGKKVSSEEELAQEDPDDVPNLQLAWEMLELAKVLFSKKPASERNSLFIAQCHSKLGELGLEVEDYAQSVGDFCKCLEIYEKYVSNSDRRLAETHYNLGLAYYFGKDYDSSLKHYQSANQVLERRIEFLDEQVDAKGDNDDSIVMNECSEIGEIKNLIPDINSKIEDVILMKRRETCLSEMGECSSSGFSRSTPLQPTKPTAQTPTGSSSAQTTHDISHLIRRKRPNTECEPNPSISASENVPAPACKKLKEELVSNVKTAPEASKIDENEKENINIAAETV